MMLTDREIIESLLQGVIIARRENLPFEQQPLDAGYWYERHMALAEEMHRLQQALAALGEREKK